jgi:hypothetical protein
MTGGITQIGYFFMIGSLIGLIVIIGLLFYKHHLEHPKDTHPHTH